MTESSKPERRRRWPWILGGIIFLPPLAAVLVLSVIFRMNAIGEEQRQPPAELLERLTATAQTAPPAADAPTRARADVSHLPTSPNLGEVPAVRSAPEALTIYEKWQDRLKLPEDFNSTHWRVGQPLLPGMADWLLANQTLIADLERLAELGGLPGISAAGLAAHRQARQAGVDEMSGWPELDWPFLNSCSLVLAAESRRRREAGDLDGAARGLLAIQPIAHSIREPFMVNVLVAAQMQNRCWLELERWLTEAPPPPELARRLRAGLAPYEITLQDVRAAAVVEYLRLRQFEVIHLEQPAWRLFQQYAGAEAGLDRSFDFWVASVFEAPLDTTRSLVYGAVRTIDLKTKADRILRDYDDYHMEMLALLDQNRLPQNEFRLHMGYVYHRPDYVTVVTRPAANQARLRVCLAVLDRIGAGEGAAPELPADPFGDGPLRSIEEAGATIFYSLGPDQSDQRAAIAYDPTNGTTSPGDIFVRLR